MSEAKMTERLFIRLDKPLKDELVRVSEQLGLIKSQVVRASIHFIIEKPSEVERIMEEMKSETDAWYKKREESNNNGEKSKHQPKEVMTEPAE